MKLKSIYILTVIFVSNIGFAQGKLPFEAMDKTDILDEKWFTRKLAVHSKVIL